MGLRAPRLRLRLPKNWPMRGVICTGIPYCSLMIGVGPGVASDITVSLSSWSLCRDGPSTPKIDGGVLSDRKG